MNVKKRFKIISVLSLLILIFINIVHAGETGKIVGLVSDNSTGEPLPGVNVVLENTLMGAVTDQEGFYLVLNVPPGKYSVSAQMIGYTTVISQNVSVMSDLTTTINFDLAPSVLESDEAIVVVAERPLIQQDITAKMSIVTSEELQKMPLENITEVLTTLPGFTDGSHLRGGRGNEVAYMIDGIYISDPLTGTFDDLMIDKDLVQELSVMSGTFNAEYGRAMSGVVNIVTVDPRPEFHGKFEYLSPMINASPYRSYEVENGQKINVGTGAVDAPPGDPGEYEYRSLTISDIFNGWDQKNLVGQFRANLSGAIPITEGLTFFVSGRYLNENNYLPFGYNLEREGMLKLVQRLSANMKLTYMGKLTFDEYQPYSHGFKYRPENYSVFNRTSNWQNLTFSHTINERTFYTLRGGYYKQTFERKVKGKEVDIQSLLANEAGDTTINPILVTDYETPVSWEGEFNYFGSDVFYLEEETRTFSGKFEITSQVNNEHLIKVGAEVIAHIVDRLWFEEPWVGGSHEYQDYRREPLELSAYIQDKVEYDFLIINLGFRLDYFDPKAKMFPNVFDPGYVDETNKFQYYPEEDAPPQVHLSPRVGLAHPVSENLVFYFAYGHFFQRPDYQDMFYLHDILQQFNVLGNPKMSAQRTQAFEFGVKQQIGNLFAVDFSLYYKDIFDLAGSSFQLYYPHNYAIYDNSDYANAKGFEITIQKRYSHYFSGNLNYTWLLAQGNENSAREGANRYWGSTNNRLRPRRVFPLNWDRRHVINLNLDVRIPPGAGPSIFGVKLLSNSGANFITQAKSGLPYTPQAIAYPELDMTMIDNSARMPWTFRVDMRLDKSFDVLGLSLTAYLKVRNLFDTKNVLSVYPVTGKPWDAGPGGHLSEDIQRYPTAYDTPRQVFAGLSLIW
jgi:outer membrane receptor protein involved in Fe transport